MQAAILNVSAFYQIGKFISNFIANYVLFAKHSSAPGGLRPPWSGANPLHGPHWGHSPRSR